MPREAAFTLADADGVDHAYRVTLHGRKGGQALVATLMLIGLEPLGRALDVVLKSKEAATTIAGMLATKSESATADDEPEPERDDLSAMADTLSGLLDGFDVAQIAADLSHALSAVDLPGFADQVFEYTLRDGKPLGTFGGTIDRHLADNSFDDAFAGNWFEYARALVKVVAANRFFGPLSTTLAR